MKLGRGRRGVRESGGGLMVACLVGWLVVWELYRERGAWKTFDDGGFERGLTLEDLGDACGLKGCCRVMARLGKCKCSLSHDSISHTNFRKRRLFRIFFAVKR